MKLITRKLHHARALILGRNSLANYISLKNILPPMLSQRKFICKKCHALDSCLFYHKAYECGTTKTILSTGLKVEFEEKTNHLTENQIQFFKKWDNLIYLEENNEENFRKEIWTMESEKREKMGRCFSHLKLLPNTMSCLPSKSISQYTYSFVRSEQYVNAKSFIESNINNGDPIMVSLESGPIALAIGYIKRIDSSSITVEVDKSLTQSQYSVKNSLNISGSLFRIDKDQLSGGSNIGRNNLIKLFIDPQCEKLRRLVVDLAEPFFSKSDSLLNNNRLNKYQFDAIHRVLSGNIKN